MTDAPERIWHSIDRRGKINGSPDAHVQPCEDSLPAYVEYVRADLAPSWQPIKTAPKSSKAILVHCGDRRNTYAVTWFRLYEGWAIFGGGALNEKPTHWMPLPAPPAE